MRLLRGGFDNDAEAVTELKRLAEAKTLYLTVLRKNPKEQM